MSSAQRYETFFSHWQASLAAHANSNNPVFLDQLRMVLQGSDYVLSQFERNPALLDNIIQNDLVRQAPSFEALNQVLSSSLDGVIAEAELHKRLRDFRQLQQCRIIWRDLAGLADLNQTLESLTLVADVCIQHAIEWHYHWLSEKHGVPRSQTGVQQFMVVIGMGKLGARELNMSSDIDLIYAYPQRGETDGARVLDNEAFFNRLAQKLNQSLNTHTPDGFVFRVDTRLRPYGESGPLAPSFDFMEIYYESQAREWERYAMIKARAVYDKDGSGAELMAMLKPFVYRRYLDFGAIDSLRTMKQMIGDNLKKRSMRDNVKLGPGGIREIEFIGQVFQLMRGGRDPDLQVRPIQQVLQLLADKNLISVTTADELLAAYRFLRLVENRIQAWRDEQTHVLPEDPAGLLRLAGLMGFATSETFIERLAAHRNAVQVHFHALFNQDSVSEDDDQTAVYAMLWRHLGDADERRRLIEQLDCPDPAGVDIALHKLSQSRLLQVTSERGHELLNAIMPLALMHCLALPNAAETLDRLGIILETIARRTTYLALLKENQTALQQLIRLLSASPWFAQWISRQPVLLDTLIDPRQLYQPLTKAHLTQELHSQLAQVVGDLEQEMEILRQFAAIHRLRIAAADVNGVIPLMIVSDYLTDLAEVSLQAALQLAWRDLTARHGVPAGLAPGEMGFVIVAYGKLGGIELGYGSDLDLVFLHESELTSMTNGAKPLDADSFYARLARRLIHIMTAQTPSGQLYEIDMRLRPNGQSGLLVTSLTAFAAYQQTQAWTWEHQALVRARVVAGDATLSASFHALRESILCKQRDGEALRLDVIDMREKMRANLDKSSATSFDLKQGIGGITDIEFIVQYALLRYSSLHPALCFYSDNIRQLEALDQARLLPDQWGERLSGLYRALRATAHRFALMEQKPMVAQDALVQERQLVQEAWHLTLHDGRAPVSH